MCGIAGHLKLGAYPPEQHVGDMVRRIRHRGPDDSGVWSSAGKECVLGHARLSIIDLSEHGHQPMVDPETGNAIVFNGEIYNFQSLRQECEAAGDRFRSHSDTEVILALFRRFGIDCLQKLRGMFAFAIWCERDKRLFLARDRVGKKPLNYALTDGGVVFCSEIDPLARHPKVSTEMDLEALELYLHLQYIPPPWSIYQDIRKLPPAHYAVFDANGLQIQRYWNVDYRRKQRISESDALDCLEEKLTDAVRLRMISDVPLGALLSGGVDSSVVVALMAKLSGEPVQTYSIGFREEAFNELPYAQQAADICATEHYPEIIEGDLIGDLGALARHYGEPYADSSAVPSFLVSKAARRHVKVVMNGDGGDELLGGYPRYSLSALESLTSRVFSSMVPAKLSSEVVPRLMSVSSLPMKVVRKLLLSYLRPELKSVVMYGAFFSDEDRSGIMPPGVDRSLVPNWRTDWFLQACAHADNPVDRMLWYDSRTYLPGDLLVKMDIASMHCGLETRSPLLDHEVIEFCATLPSRYKANRGVGKYLLKMLAERFFPREFVHRQKKGFGIPVADWLRGPLRPILEETLRNESLMSPLHNTAVTKQLDDFLHRGALNESRLWALMMYGIWRNRVLEEHQ